MHEKSNEAHTNSNNSWSILAAIRAYIEWKRLQPESMLSKESAKNEEKPIIKTIAFTLMNMMIMCQSNNNFVKQWIRATTTASAAREKKQHTDQFNTSKCHNIMLLVISTFSVRNVCTWRVCFDFALLFCGRIHKLPLYDLVDDKSVTRGALCFASTEYSRQYANRMYYGNEAQSLCTFR